MALVGVVGLLVVTGALGRGKPERPKVAPDQREEPVATSLPAESSGASSTPTTVAPAASSPPTSGPPPLPRRPSPAPASQGCDPSYSGPSGVEGEAVTNPCVRPARR